MARNRKGQYASENIINLKISKALQNIANDVAIRVKPIIRDELEKTLRYEIYASRTPATKKGLTTKEYNESHSHQKVKPYHHTGLLASSVYATIDGDTIKANIKDQQYDNGSSTTDVYDYLKSSPYISRVSFLTNMPSRENLDLINHYLVNSLL